jgi:hypothetical protein
LHACQLGYRVAKPDDAAVLGARVTESDRDFMVNALVPVSSMTGLTTAQGMALHVRGSAQKDGRRVAFDWGFSGVPFAGCLRRIEGKLETGLPLVGAQTIDVNVTIDPRRLFSLMVPTDRGFAIEPTPANSLEFGEAWPYLPSSTCSEPP